MDNLFIVCKYVHIFHLSHHNEINVYPIAYAVTIGHYIGLFWVGGKTKTKEKRKDTNTKNMYLKLCQFCLFEVKMMFLIDRHRPH